MDNAIIRRLKNEGNKKAKAQGHSLCRYTKENALFYWSECKRCGAMVTIRLGAVGTSGDVAGAACNERCIQRGKPWGGLP